MDDPIGSRPTAATRSAPFRGVGMALAAGWFVLGIAVFFPPIAILGAVVLAFGVPIGFFSRTGPCPNCDASVLMFGGCRSAKCRDCGHRLVHRNGQLIDVT